uniref:Uncharacterized protein n=1 Tax=Odontella aurita TaxID=265563 RepID=A0A7S4IA79_9STRA|mmetsp:Transcript_21993/g.65065  ORF Transcript_21993/g.65065 Transcript_21993/m.65065 type:complete len:191 (+) Transcript_21993:555-1127(+)
MSRNGTPPPGHYPGNAHPPNSNSGQRQQQQQRSSVTTTSTTMPDGTTVVESVNTTVNPDGSITEEIKTWSLPPGRGAALGASAGTGGGGGGEGTVDGGGDPRRRVQEMSPSEAREAIRAALEWGVLGSGLRREAPVSGNGGGGGEATGAADLPPTEDFFPELLELSWPPEGRLIEKDCTCDLWDRIRYRY